MAIYHLEAKVVSRGTGRSAVAASAYLSCTNILNDYDGVMVCNRKSSRISRAAPQVFFMRFWYLE